MDMFEPLKSTPSAMTEFALFFRAHRLFYSIIVGGVAFLLQIFLFYAIIYKSPAQFQIFKSLVFVDNFVAFLFNLSCVIFQPMADSKDGNIFLMFDGYFGHIKQPYNCALWMFFMFIMLSTVVVLPLQYIYRYFLIVRKFTITTKHFTCMFIFALAIIAGHCISGQYAFSYNNSEAIQQEFGVLLKQDPFYALDVPVFTVLDKSRPIVIAHFLFNSSILMGSYIIVLICSYKILNELRRSTKSMSRTTREMNAQLSLLLFIQAAVPFVSLSLPVLTQVLLSLFGVSMPNACVCLVVFIEWAPIVDALATIFIVPSYRQILLFWRPTKTTLLIQHQQTVATILRRSNTYHHHYAWNSNHSGALPSKKGSF